MGWKSERNKAKRETIEHMVIGGASNAEIQRRGLSTYVVSRVRKKLNIPDPRELLTRAEASKAKTPGKLKTPQPARHEQRWWL